MGACTLSNRASRFNPKPSIEAPGPGSYETYVNQSPRSTMNDIIKHSRQNLPKYIRKSVPPSIPDLKYSYGFQEDAEGNMIPHQPIDIDPNFTNSTILAENDSSKHYQGVHFGKYSSKRTNFAGKPGPGPGHYDVYDAVKLEVQHANTKVSDKRSELQVLRYPDSLMQTAARDGIPGPGQYSVKRDLDPESSKGDLADIEAERPPFGSQAKRFDVPDAGVPGPGSYSDKLLSAFNTTQTKTTNIKKVPFNQTTARFVSPDYKSRSIPGPAQYRLTAFTDDNLRRAAAENGRKPPFNVASVRRLNIMRKDDFNTPGPTTYDVKTEPFKPKIDQPSANFASNTARDLLIEDIPGPAAYDVPRAYQSLITQHRKSPRSKIARQRQSQFLSAAKRTFASETVIDTPGPGTYDGSITSRPHGYAPMRDARFRFDKDKLPGPADYELSPLFQDTVLRGTFNSTLNNPILVKLQDRALREDLEAAAGFLS